MISKILHCSKNLIFYSVSSIIVCPISTARYCAEKQKQKHKINQDHDLIILYLSSTYTVPSIVLGMQ